MGAELAERLGAGQEEPSNLPQDSANVGVVMLTSSHHGAPHSIEADASWSTVKLSIFISFN